MFSELFIDNRGEIQNFVAITMCVAALIWGGGPERIVAAAWLVVFEFAGVVQNWIFGDGVQLSEVDWFVASTDVIAGIIFIGVALYANRNYTLWIAAMQVLAVTAHLARGIADLIAPIAYAVMFIAPGWVQLFLLGAGVLRHVLRKRKHGDYRDWRIRKPVIELRAETTALSGESAWQQVRQPTWRDDVK